MTMKIKDLREPPLLNAPKREPLPEWLKITRGDMELIGKDMAASRHPINGPVDCPLAEAYMFLKELGVPYRMTDEDRGVIRGDMGMLRAGIWDDVFAKLQYMTHRLDIGEKLSVGDVQKMESGLEHYRKERWWDRVAQMHHYMHALGVGSEITPEDKEGMAGYLENERKERTHGRLVGLILWHMKGAGLKPEVTDRDRRLLKGHLEWVRQVGNGGAIAETHYINRLIREDDALEGHREMPPLKRFRP